MVASGDGGRPSAKRNVSYDTRGSSALLASLADPCLLCDCYRGEAIFALSAYTVLCCWYTLIVLAAIVRHTLQCLGSNKQVQVHLKISLPPQTRSSPLVQRSPAYSMITASYGPVSHDQGWPCLDVHAWPGVPECGVDRYTPPRLQNACSHRCASSKRSATI